ncbi:MAG: hypothetical protein PHY44_06555 [Lachnospiraceae bacterium]|nr:hypothetical protein [Lachnospiraceae bacterium]
MRCVDRNGKIIGKSGLQDRLLSFMYTSKLGKILLVEIIKPKYSIIMGHLLNLRISKVLIQPFVFINKIDMTQYKKCEFS